MGALARISRLLPVPASIALLLGPGVRTAQATYTGQHDLGTVGTLAAAGGWIAVPVHAEAGNSGEITGEPSFESASSLAVARVTGSRFITFEFQSATKSTTMGPMLAAGAANEVAAAWVDRAGSADVDLAELGAHGTLPAPALLPGASPIESLSLSSGPDGAVALLWRNAGASHAVAVAAGTSAPVPLLGPGVALDPAERVVLSGGSSFWLLGEAGGSLQLAPGMFGQDAAPAELALGPGSHATALGDGVHGLWVLAQRPGGWVAAHVTGAGQISSAALPHGAADPVMALAGTSAVVAYRAGAHCGVWLERLRPAAAGAAVLSRIRVPSGGGCPAPRAIAVDPASGTAYLLTQSPRAVTLTTESRTGKLRSWRGAGGESVLTIAAAGSEHVAVETYAKGRQTPEECGGAGPGFSQTYFVRVFHGARLTRTGHLAATESNC